MREEIVREKLPELMPSFDEGGVCTITAGVVRSPPASGVQRLSSSV